VEHALGRQERSEHPVPPTEPVGIAGSEQQRRTVGSRGAVPLEPDPEPAKVAFPRYTFGMPGARAAGLFDLVENRGVAQEGGEHHQPVHLPRPVARIEGRAQSAKRDPGEPDPLDPPRTGRGDHVVVQPFDDRPVGVIAEVAVEGNQLARGAVVVKRAEEALALEVLFAVADPRKQNDEASIVRSAREPGAWNGNRRRPRPRRATGEQESGEQDPGDFW
jgi:hypothetical protein